MMNLLEELEKKDFHKIYNCSCGYREDCEIKRILRLEYSSARKELIKELHEQQNCYGIWKTPCHACKIINSVLGEN